MKTKIFGILALALALGACQKEKSSTTKAAEAKTGLQNKTLTSNLVAYSTHYYVDLDLVSTNPNVYHASWSGTNIYVTNVFWDSATYPSAYTGAPLYGTVSLALGTTGNILDATGNGAEGTVFTLATPTSCGSGGGNTAANAIEIFEGQLLVFDYHPSSAPPTLNTGTACQQVDYDLKLIRSTTGTTGFAVATSDYQATYKAPVSTGTIGLWVPVTTGDPVYTLFGRNGLITGAQKNGTNLAASGTYMKAGTVNYLFNASGTITDPSAPGGTVTFSFTNEDIR